MGDDIWTCSECGSHELWDYAKEHMMRHREHAMWERRREHMMELDHLQWAEGVANDALKEEDVPVPTPDADGSICMD